MDMHHKLRRDPSWHPNGCNICGQLGHQAANCSIGTIQWKRIFGENAFRLLPPIYWTEVQKAKQEKIVDHKQLEERAKQFAMARCKEQNIDYEEITRAAQKSHADFECGAIQQLLVAKAKAEADVAAARGETMQQQAPQVVAQANGEPPLPQGWSVAHDQQGRPYYWHQVTKQVQWERPTA